MYNRFVIVLPFCRVKW